MPVMPRMNNKAKKIFYGILGKPANMRKDKTEKDSKIDKRLNFEDTYQAR